MNHDLPAEVIRALGVGDQSPEPMVGGRVSTFWRAQTKDAGRPVAVRRTPPWRRRAEVVYECEVLRALHRSGAPIAVPLADPVEVDGSVWTAFAWIDGEHPARKLGVPDPAPYGRLLAELHAHSQPLVAMGQRPGWARLDQFLTHPRGDSHSTLEEQLPGFEAAFEAGPRLRRLAMEAYERLQAAGPDGLPHVIAHGDFGPHQVMFAADGRVAAVVDWDFCHYDIRAADLALVTSCARPAVDGAAELIAAYTDHTRLEPEELALLPDLRRAFHLNNLANVVVAVWAAGGDIDRPVALIAERMEREQWWGPMLVDAVRSLDRPRSTRHAGPDPVLTDLEVAQALADRAAVVAMHYFGEGVEAEAKADGSPVTDADRAVEVLLREGLAELRPGDAILGEEFGVTGAAERTWILDPIDGTAQFAVGDPNWRIQIALEEHGRITVALVDAPALGVRWWATENGGTYEAVSGERPRRLEASGHASVAGAHVACHKEELAVRMPGGVRWQDPRSPLPLVEVIRGELDAFFVECCQVWDHAPWVLLVQEAGGRFTDHEGGSSPARRGGLYSNGPLHEELLAAISPPPAVGPPPGPASEPPQPARAQPR